MNHLRPIKQLPTHEVENMPPYMGNQDLWKNDKITFKRIKICQTIASQLQHFYMSIIV